MLDKSPAFDTQDTSIAAGLPRLPPIAPTGNALQAMISSPEKECTLEDFLPALSVRDILFECEGDGPLAQHPAFPGAIRQVIGTELMTTASREALGGLACPWEPACGMHVFFNGDKDRHRPALPPPWIIRTETTGADGMRITLRLYGLGLSWTSELAEACHRALERGISFAGIEPACQSVLLRSVEQVWTGLQDPLPGSKSALISFVTPLARDNEDSAQSEGKAFLVSLANRSRDIARWHGIALCDDWEMIETMLAEYAVNECGLGEIAWNRCISQQGGAKIGMRGLMGLMQIDLEGRDNEAVVRLLQIGALLHTGRNLAFGQGRYDLHFTGA